MLNFDIGVFITNRVRDRREKPTAKRGLVAIARPSLRGHEANQVTHKKLKTEKLFGGCIYFGLPNSAQVIEINFNCRGLIL